MWKREAAPGWVSQLGITTISFDWKTFIDMPLKKTISKPLGNCTILVFRVSVFAYGKWL